MPRFIDGLLRLLSGEPWMERRSGERRVQEERRHAPPGKPAGTPVTSPEDLRQVANLDRGDVPADGRVYTSGRCKGGHGAPCETKGERRTGEARASGGGRT